MVIAENSKFDFDTKCGNTQEYTQAQQKSNYVKLCNIASNIYQQLLKYRNSISALSNPEVIFLKKIKSKFE